MLSAPRKRTRRHEIFHYLHTVLVFKSNAGHLIKGHHIPETDKTNLPGIDVIKKVGYGGLAARHQNAVGGALFINMAFTRTARS